MSPTVFREKGYRFFFFSREETRMHVHVSHANGEAKFWLQPIIELAQNFGLSSRELKEVDQMVKTHQQDIKNAWYKHEVLGISKHGFWLLLDETEELFVSFAHFPWFKKAAVEQIFCLERPQPHHLYWADLDVDSIRHPEKFPLISTSN